MRDRIKVYVVKFGDRPALQLQWRDREGRLNTRSAKTKDRRVAKAAASDLEYELSRGLHFESSKLPWAEFRQRFEAEYLPERRPTTQDKYDGVLNVFEAKVNPGRVADVSTDTLKRYARLLKEDGAAPATIHSHLLHLGAVLAWAVTQGVIRERPAMPKVHVPDKLPRKVSGEDFDKLLAKAPSEAWRAFLLTAWYTGLRLSESLALTWFDVDFAGNKIAVHAETSKGKRNEWVPLHPELRAVLERLPRDTERVFPLSRRADSISHRVSKWARQAGVNCTLHDLRRTFGSRLATEVSAPVLQRLMRHRSLATTMRYYVNVEDGLQDAIRKLA